jgi:DNA-binding MurR/RpiR family transcriptional regulator
MDNNRNLIHDIEAKFSSLSKGHKLVANFILDHYDKAAFITASKLGGTVGVSESTVIRFANQLGYEGYVDLQKELRELIKTKLTAAQRMEVAYDMLNGGDLLKVVLGSDIDKIKHTLENISHEEFEKVIQTILGSKKIYIVGFRSSGALAKFLGFYLNLILDNVVIVESNAVSEVFEQIFRISEEDVMIGISFPRYSQRTLKAVHYARSKGAQVVAFTDNIMSPLSKLAQSTIIARADMTSFVDSLVAPLSVINALIVGIAMHSKQEIVEKFEKLETMWEESEVYQKDEK